MFLRRPYYFIKPTLPWALRIAVRRFFAKRLRQKFSGSWPINHLAGRAPGGWGGWPDGKKFAFVITHDVEGRKGLDRCRPLADLEIGSGFRSSFNFVPEGEYATPKSLRDSLIAQGFEVGVHDLHHDGKLYNSRKTFHAKARRINKHLADWNAVGFRAGSMLHNLDWLRDLNILYDASTFDTDPFEPQPDGVNTIFPFWVPRGDGSGYVELPYTLPQDSTLFLLFQEPSNEIWKKKLDWVAQHGGLALVGVHPDYMNFANQRSASEYEVDLYRDFLDYVATRYREEAWFALPHEVAAHVRQQQVGRNAINAGNPAGTHPESKVPAATTTPGSLSQNCATSSNPWRLQGKRVGMVLFSFYPGDPRPRRAAEALVSQGMSVELICLRENGNSPTHEVFNGVEIRRVPITRRRGGVPGYLFQYSAFLAISFAILALRSLSRRYDLIYVHNMPDILVFSGLIPRVFGAKVILDLHDPMPELMMTIFGFPKEARAVRFLEFLERRSLAFADSVITVNEACAKLFASRSCPAQKIQVVMNSPDEEIFRFRPPAKASTTRSENKPFVIMYHGSLVERNGLDLAVDAFARVRQSIPGAVLRIFGSRNPFLERVMESVRNRGLQDAVHYLGPKPLEQIVEAIEQCDVGVIPNQRCIFTELNTPTRIFEYLAIGKPVIAPRAPGICDYFDDDSLLFFELGSEEDLAQKIQYAYEHPEEVTRIVERGQEVHRAHTWQQEKQRLTGVVTRMLVDRAGLVPAVEELQRSGSSQYGERL